MRVITSFCQTCNARERVIEYGKCVVCGNEPTKKAGVTVAEVDAKWAEAKRARFMEMAGQRLDTWHEDQTTRWTALDWYILVLCVVGTLYLVGQVVRWMI